MKVLSIVYDNDSYTVKRNPGEVKHKGFYFSRVEMLNTKGEHTNTFRYNEKLILFIDLSGNPLPSDYASEFYIYNELGQLISVGSSGWYHSVYFNKNAKKIRIEIGPLTITSGKYRILLSVMTGAIRADTWGNACSFTIIESWPYHPDRDILSVAEGPCILQQSFSAVE